MNNITSVKEKLNIYTIWNVKIVYQLDCICSALYIGKTKKKVITRTIEHQQDKRYTGFIYNYPIKTQGIFNILLLRNFRSEFYTSLPIAFLFLWFFCPGMNHSVYFFDDNTFHGV